MINNIRTYFENNLFGVCAYLGEKIDMPSFKIRLFFIYASFLTAGSPIIVYMTMAFVIKLKDYVKGNRSYIWDF
jgi:phage shock protein C